MANLLDRDRMRQLEPAASGRILSAYLRPQPDDTIARFPYERHLGAITGTNPHWPDGTRAISELRLSFRVKPKGLMGGISTLGGLTGPRTVHLDIVDYPGEWLLDLGLMEKSYADWSATALDRLASRPGGQDYLNAMAAAGADAQFEDELAERLAHLFASSLRASREAGFSDCSPGRFLLPGEMEGSPALTFAPLPPGGAAPRHSLRREFERRYEAYKSKIVKPFFRDHFSRIDRQVVLLDVLGAIHDGPAALEDLRQVMAEVLGAFRPGANSWLSGLLLGRRVEKILFAATKADHLHHSQHGQLTAITEALVREARDRAQFAGAETGAMSLAALRATVEESRQHGGRTLDLVRGRRLDTGAEAAFYPGELPSDPMRLLAPAREGAGQWLDEDYQVMRFAPAPLTLVPGEGPPHIRLDRAAQFLFGDRL